MSVQVTRPSLVGDTQQWDCHIWNWPTIASAALGGSYDGKYTGTAFTPKLGNISGYPSNPNGGTGYYSSGISIASGPLGVQFMPNSGLTALNQIDQGTINPIAKLNGRFRIVGLAFEVINTTAELYKSGLVTCYRMPQMRGSIGTVPNLTTLFPKRAITYSLPPTNVGEALVLPGSKQWSAKDGAYVVCTQNSLNNDFCSAESDDVYYMPNQLIQDSAETMWCMANAIPISNSGQNYSVRYHSPYNTSGVYFTGLSPETTLQINAKFIVETMPGPYDVLATLAQPSTQYNPEAIRLYGETIGMLPVGVPVTENPTGEWFSEVLGTIGELASSASLINPLFGLVGQGFGIGKQIFDKVRNIADAKVKESEKKKRPNLVVMPNVPLPRSKMLAIKNDTTQSKAKLKPKTPVKVSGKKSVRV